MKLDIYLNEGLRQVRAVGPNGLPPLDIGWTLIDTQYHPGVPPHVDNQGPQVNHVVWHHIRNALYRRGLENPADLHISYSGIIKGGTLWKPTSVEFMEDQLRHGGKLDYDPATGIFTFTRHDYASDHPTIGVLIKRWGQPGAPDLKGHFYMEVVSATPADFDPQPEGTVNVGLHLCNYENGKDNSDRAGNLRDTARIRRVYTEEAPSHLHVIEPSDSDAHPNRQALLLYVRGLRLGRSIQFRIKANGQAIRAAMGKTKVSMPQGRIANVSLADWTVIESDSNVQGLLMVSGTNIPAGSIPI